MRRIATLFGLFVAVRANAGDAPPLGPPVDCAAGETCFVQQYADMQPGPGVADPFCGQASYDGHDGVDIRVASLVDMRRGVPVVAMADGTVLRSRDGEEDHLVANDADRGAIRGRECGNGLVIDLGGGLEAQYCHFMKGSVEVKAGDRVAAGTRLGLIGASGLAEFPHVHVAIRRNGALVDPFTGAAVGGGCVAEAAMRKPLWDAAAGDWMAKAATNVLGSGLAGAPLDYDRLVSDGPPSSPTTGDGALVGWGWFANLAKGDRIRIAIVDPAGRVFIDQTSEPLDRAKASYASYAGKRGAPAAGEYGLRVELLRGDSVLASREKTVTVAP